MSLYPSFCGGSYVSQSPSANQELTMNFYVERMEVQSGKVRDMLYPTPGVESFATALNSPGRAFFTHKGRSFAVIGAKFSEVDSAGTLTERGTVAIDQYPATMCTNGDGGGQVFVTSGNNGYIFDLSANTFTLVRTGATRMGAHLDGYFLALDTDTSTLFLSNLLDGTTWDPTQFAQRSSRPDPWVSMAILDRYIWLFGSETSEVWYNAGSFPFPFTPHPSGLVTFGCGAIFSPLVVDGALMWLASTKDGSNQVVRAQGFSPEMVSTYALNYALAQMTTTADAIGDTYQDLGHTFYLLSLPAASRTVCFDTKTGWTDRGTWIAEQNRYVAWRPLYHTYAFGKHLMLDRETGSIWELSSNFFSDVDGRPIRRVRRAPVLNKEHRRLFVSRFELDLETGLGLPS